MGVALRAGRLRVPEHPSDGVQIDPSIDHEARRAVPEIVQADVRETRLAPRQRVKQASRDLLASIKARLGELDRFWEKEQTKAEVEVFILDQVFASLPTPPFSPNEKKAVAARVYAHVWQQALRGDYAQAA